ncbi:MAG TPA: ATP-binding cassette domain-containing protein, partial [Candidatus Rifleibacterium sp.]|nr:ATP-binding cassette domain-containing protein [Candidatus Rifleibacterium sp.]
MIAVQSLTRHFGSIKAVDNISFTVDKGEILGFLGPNGAGKSTTMKMITTFLPPTSGTATVGGFDVIAQPLEAR